MLGNSWRQWLHHLFNNSSRRTGRKTSRRPRQLRPWLEILENRITPTTIMAPDIEDNTLFQVFDSSSAAQLSDGAGTTFFVGKLGPNGGGAVRRGAIKFDLSAVPTGATITDATLTLTQARDHSFSAENVSLHALQADWGEGASVAFNGKGATPDTNDATWYFNKWDSEMWNTPGGDFAATASATTSVTNTGSNFLWSGAGLVNDVQNWVNNPTSNFGWIVIGDETVSSDAMEFDTKESASPPTLSVTFASGTPSLGISKTHAGTFRQGDSGDVYTVQVTNTGSAATSGTVTVTDTLPTGLTPNAADTGNINGWAVSTTGQQITATRSDALTVGSSYANLPLKVNVASNAPASLTNTASVSGGGAASPASSNDPTTITQVADLTIAKSHTGTFKEGDNGDTYSVTVKNTGAGPTTGAVTVSDTLPNGLSPTAADNGTSNGWTLATSGQTVTATRSDALAAGGSYLPLTITVNVASVAPSSVTNTASVSGGGELNTGNDSSSDPTPITVVATKLVISTSTTATAGTPFNFTVTAQDGGGNTATGFSGNVTLSSSPGADISPTSVVLTSGTATIPVTLTTAGTQTITAAFTGLTSSTATITVSPGGLNKYLVTAPASTTAGTGFLLSIQASDQFNNAITNYSGPANVTASITPATSASNFPATIAINSHGLGLFLGDINLVGSYTLTVTGGTFSGSGGPITVTAGPAVKLAFAAQPANTPTGVTLPPVKVKLVDAFGNLVNDSSHSVTLSVATGPGSFATGSTTTAQLTNGQATFNNLTLIQPGSYTLRDMVPGLYTGPNSNQFFVVPLEVAAGSFASSPTGFSLAFDAPILVTATTPALYGTGFGPSAPAPSVTLTQIKDASGSPIPPAAVAGSVILNTSTNSLTFLETDTVALGTGIPPILADGTYVARLRSTGATGFQAINSGGGFLDGLGTGTAGSGDFTATFTVGAAAANDSVVWVPATADGPGQSLQAPGNNQGGGGYPVYLDNSTGTVTSVQVTLNYNSALLTVSGVTGANFALLGSSTPGHAVLQYSGPALAKGTQTPIGFVTATVFAGTSGNPAPYKAKDLLHLSGISLNGGAVPAIGADALHLVSYVGDADGSASYNSNDAVLITRVSLQTDTGFAAYPLVDPTVVADTDGAGFIPADAALQANEAGVGFQTANLAIPPIPTGTVIQPVANNLDPIATLAPVAVNTLIQVPTSSPSAQLSNGAGQFFFVGDTDQPNNKIRRGALKFDLSGVPAGATITSVTLSLNMSKTRSGPQNVSLHQALQTWGAGTSVATGEEGRGAPATTGDATWFYSFFSSQTWTTPGGNFAAPSSATTLVGTVGMYQWSGAGLVADVQQWVNNPGSNFGWILTGNETGPQTAMQFDSELNPNASTRPVLTVDYILPAASLSISKSHTGNFHQGDAADSYTVTVSNTGSGSTSGSVTVTDTVPAGLSPTAADSGTINGWSVSTSGQTITAVRSDALAAGSSYPALTITVSVASNAPASVTNTASVSGGGSPSPVNANDPTTIVSISDLTIAKSHTGTFKAGDSADKYTVTVSNIGSGSTSGTVTVTDHLPTGLSGTAADSGTINGWSVSSSGQIITATRSDVLAGGSSYPVLTLTVSVAATAPASVTNTATVAGGGELNTGNDSASDPTTITQLPDLTISKTHSGTFRPGDTADVYTITVGNAGSVATSATVTVTDTLPAGLSATAADSGTVNGWSLFTSGQIVTATRSDVLNGGASYPPLTITVSVANNIPPVVTNSVTVAGGGEVNTANDTATDATATIPVADLTLTKTHTGNFRQGDAADVYVVTVKNIGPAATNGEVMVTDTLPAGLAPTPADSGTINGWSVSTSGQMIIATRSDALAPGSSYPVLNITVSVAANAPASVKNAAVVSGGGEVNTVNDGADDTTSITQVADLTISKMHNGNFHPGDAADTYTITVTNVGGGGTTGTVTVTDQLPAGLSATAADSGTIGGWLVSFHGQTVTATRSDVLAAGSSYAALTITVSVASNAPASVTNTATVAGGGEVNTGNDTATDVTAIAQLADLAIGLSDSGNFKQGSTGSYTITIGNIGRGATDAPVTIVDVLPAGLTYAGASSVNGWTITVKGQTVTATRSDALASGALYQLLTLTVNIASNAPASVTNTVMVSGGGETNVGNDAGADVTTVFPGQQNPRRRGT
jgi:uncharacterized repeat protein (TIGR01451 family)